MQYKFIDTDGSETYVDNYAFLENIISKPPQYRLMGSGDTAIQITDSERLIVIKLENGIFIIQSPDYLSPIISKNMSTSWQEHYVGGEKMMIPDLSLCNEITALKILKHYIEFKRLWEAYEWIDCYI